MEDEEDQKNFNLRKLTKEDFTSFYPIFERLIKNEIPEIIKQHKFFLDGDFSRDRVYAALGYPQIVIIGCFIDEKLIGFLWGNNGYAGLGFVSWLMVEKEYRNHGYGRALLAEYERYIKNHGGHVIELYCFEAMKDYYLKNNYEIIGIRPKGYFGLKQFIMNKVFAQF